ncbi:MAG: hypothetical protein ACOCQG_02130 [Candidatus Nanoarchaeia archaeon]
MGTLILDEERIPCERKTVPVEELTSALEYTIEAARGSLKQENYNEAKNVVESFRMKYSYNFHMDEYREDTTSQLMGLDVNLLWAKSALGSLNTYKNELLTSPQKSTKEELTGFCIQAALKLEDIGRAVENVKDNLSDLKTQNSKDALYLRSLKFRTYDLEKSVEQNTLIFNNILPDFNYTMKKRKNFGCGY